MSGVNDKTLGAFLVGGTVNIFLLGLTLSQQWTYFSSFPEDRDRSSRQWWIVVFLVPFSIGESICCMLTCYHNLVTLNGSPVSLKYAPLSLCAQPALIAIIATFVHCLLAHRVDHLSGMTQRIVPVTILGLSLVQLGFGIGASVHLFLTVGLFVKIIDWSYGIYTWLAAGVLADILIFAALVYYLRKTEPELEGTRKVIDRLLRNALETCFLTACTAIIDVSLFAAHTGRWNVTFLLILPKLYINTLLVNLNSRSLSRSERSTRAVKDRPKSIRNSLGYGRRYSAGAIVTAGNVRFSTSTIRHVDMDVESPDTRPNSLTLDEKRRTIVFADGTTIL